jgi:hypothetical protein
MVLSIETTLMHPRRGFVKLEDTVAVTETGRTPSVTRPGLELRCGHNLRRAKWSIDPSHPGQNDADRFPMSGRSGSNNPGPAQFIKRPR